MISAIVLAAGMSTRMGSPKALLEWEGESLASYQVSQLRQAGVEDVVIVLGYRSDEVARTLRRAQCRIMNNARYFTGRAGSLRIGTKAVNRDSDAIIVVNVDQPRPASFYRELIAAHLPERAATRPAHGARTGHPVIVSQRLREELLAVSDEEDGLRGVLRRHENELGSYEAGELALVDMNTPDEYEAAKSASPIA